MNIHEEKQKGILFSTRLTEKDESFAESQAELHFDDLFTLEKHMQKFFKEKNWHEHNKLVPLYRKLYKSHNFDLKAGELVETHAWTRWEPAKILEHNLEENTFLVENERGWKCNVPGSLIRKLTQGTQQVESTYAAAEEIPEITQLSLFL